MADKTYVAYFITRSDGEPLVNTGRAKKEDVWPIYRGYAEFDGYRIRRFELREYPEPIESTED